MLLHNDNFNFEVLIEK
ncbi:hypothetical protein [Borrelia miyamotoi]